LRKVQKKRGVAFYYYMKVRADGYIALHGVSFSSGNTA
jgi:hypothetical protein